MFIELNDRELEYFSNLTKEAREKAMMDDEIIKNEVIQQQNETNKNLTNMNYKQDILTKQAIEEIKDNIEMFKMDINKYVNELREEQEKIELGDVKEEIKILEDTLTKDLKDTKDQNEANIVMSPSNKSLGIAEKAAPFPRDAVITIMMIKSRTDFVARIE